MGTSVELCIGNVSLSCSKNFMGADYGFFFQDGDLSRRKTDSDSVDYDYYEEHPDDDEFAVAEELFARTLSRTLPRLEMLGFTLEAARAEYQEVVKKEIEKMAIMEELKNYFLTFDKFCDLACRYPLHNLKSGCMEYETPGRFIADLDFLQIPGIDNPDSYWSEASYLSARICILSAESMLQIFALNAANAKLEVTWKFGPIVYEGWVQREEFQPNARRKQKILIATEGKSDTSIIQRSLNILRPDVADFFNFVDVTKKHHFWSTGSLVNFAEGLLRIDVLNKVLFVFDNDAEGVAALSKLEKLKLPTNMRSMLLPDLEEFRNFSICSPEGVSDSDINGHAAAIECYLDLDLDQYRNKPPQVIRNSSKKDLDVWQGALEHKGSYSTHFYNQSDDSLRDGSYDTSKLLKLVDVIIQEAGLVVPVI